MMRSKAREHLAELDIEIDVERRLDRYPLAWIPMKGSDLRIS
jgi:hypothetical protein